MDPNLLLVIFLSVVVLENIYSKEKERLKWSLQKDSTEEIHLH
jgi:hypothetical protein